MTHHLLAPRLLVQSLVLVQQNWPHLEKQSKLQQKQATYRMILMSSNGAQLAELVDLYVHKKIQPVIDSVYPFTKSIEALEHLLKGCAKGKIVIKH